MGRGDRAYVASDHQQVSLVLAQSALKYSTTRSMRPIQYPISSHHPEWVQQALLSDLIDRNVGRALSTRTWNDQVFSMCCCDQNRAQALKKTVCI